MTHPTYNKATVLFDDITLLLQQHEFSDNFSDEEWLSLLGAWQACGDGIRAKCDLIKRQPA